jgi:peroxiredoxin
LQSRIQDIRAAGADVVAVSVDPPDRARQVVDRLALEFPVLSDADRSAIAAYGVVHAAGGVGGDDIARPATFLIGPDGTVLWRDLTDNWRVRVRPERILEAIAATR